jgi:hypothetical protein
VSSPADRDALSRGYANASLARGPTDLQLCSFDPRFTTAALTAAFAGILPYRSPPVLRDSPAKTVNRPSGFEGTNGSNLILSRREAVSLPHLVSGVENAGFRRGWARLAWRLGRQRRAGGFDIAPTGGNI